MIALSVRFNRQLAIHQPFCATRGNEMALLRGGQMNLYQRFSSRRLVQADKPMAFFGDAANTSQHDFVYVGWIVLRQASGLSE